MWRRADRDGSTAKVPSLRVWRDYFPRAKLFGFDIDEFATVKIPNCTIVRGDSSSGEDVRGLGDLGPFDIVIEDASHASHHQQITLAALFPFMKSGGLFRIEDLHWQSRFSYPSIAARAKGRGAEIYFWAPRKIALDTDRVRPRRER